MLQCSFHRLLASKIIGHSFKGDFKMWKTMIWDRNGHVSENEFDSKALAYESANKVDDASLVEVIGPNGEYDSFQF